MSSSKEPYSKIEKKISYKVLAIIAVLAVGYHIYISSIPEESDNLEFADFSYGIGALACGIAGILIAKRYRGSEVFGKAYFALGLAFLLLFAGDLTWNYIELVLEDDPYPSLADVFYLGLYPLAGIHLILNIKYFKKDLGILPKIGVPALAILMVAIFFGFSFEDVEDLDFVFALDMVYVLGSATIFALSILGAAIFRQSVLGTAWLLLAVGIFIFTVADVWYYYLEIQEAYTGNHPVNTVWILSFMITVYALYKHKKII